MPPLAEDHAYHTAESKLLDGKIYLEDLDLTAKHCEQTDIWAKHIAEQFALDESLVTDRFLILPDNLLDFLAETATEIRTRVRINPATNTVQNGALWTEEYLPAETLLWGTLACDRARNKVDKNGKDLLGLLHDRTIQLGGNATTGGGQTRWIMREIGS